MRIIIIEDQVYKVSETVYNQIKAMEAQGFQDIEMYDFLQELIPKITHIGGVSYDFRL
jgi:hypothetical protein